MLVTYKLNDFFFNVLYIEWSLIVNYIKKNSLVYFIIYYLLCFLNNKLFIFFSNFKEQVVTHTQYLLDMDKNLWSPLVMLKEL